MLTATKGPLWTQDEAIAFEVARECINDLMGIYHSLAYKEQHAPSPDAGKIAQYLAQAETLFTERKALRLNDADAIKRVSSVYGTRIRNHRVGTELLG